MRLGRIRLRGFKSFENAIMDFRTLHAACVSGENGSGKSTLVVDAPLWALFGAQHADLDSVVSKSGQTAQVDLEVIDDDMRWLISRSRNRGGKSGLAVKSKPIDAGDDVEWSPVISGMKPAQQYIESVILNGCSYTELISSVYMVQGNHSVFTRATNAEAKEIFMSLLALDVWKERNSYVSAQRAEAQRSRDRLEAAIATMESNTAPVDEHELEEVSRLAAELKTAALVLRDHEERMTALRKEYLELQTKNRSLQDRLIRLRTEQDPLKKSKTCYACGQAVDEVRRLEMLDELESQIADLEVEYTAVEEATRQSRLRGEAAVEAFTQEHSDLSNADLPSVELRLSEAEQHKAVLQYRLEEQASAAQRIDERRAELELISKRVDELTTAATMFGRDGIPAYMMDAALPSVESRTNQLLEMMSDGQLTIRIETQRLTKTAGMKESLEILVADESGQYRPFSTYSGGEGFRINFALRVALAELVARHSGTDISMLVIDEPEGLDEPGREALVSALAVVSEMFETIILISHHADLRTALPQSIYVAKEHGVSSVSVSV